MKVIFLDIDGVLNNLERCEWLHHNYKKGCGFGEWWALPECGVTAESVGWDQRCVDALWHLVNESGAAVVISSTWRMHNTMEDIESYFEPYGPRLPIRGETGVSYNRFRGDEINHYLEHHPEVTQWVCIDDDGDFYPENNLVKTDIQVGLTMEDAGKAVEILRR